MQTNYDDKNSSVNQWYKLTPDAKSVGKLFLWNIGANAVVGIGSALIGEFEQTKTSLLNIGRSVIYIGGEEYIKKREKKKKPVNTAQANGFRAGFMFMGAGTNAFQMFDATTKWGQIAGGLAFLTYLGLGITSLLMDNKKQITVPLSKKIYDAQVDLVSLQEQVSNDNQKNPQITDQIKQKEGYINVVSDITAQKEEEINLLYRIKQGTGYTIIGRALFQIGSGVINIVQGKVVTGICEITGGLGFTYGANEYRKKQNQEMKDRKLRLARRKVLFRKNDPTYWKIDDHKENSYSSAKKNTTLKI